MYVVVVAPLVAVAEILGVVSSELTRSSLSLADWLDWLVWAGCRCCLPLSVTSIPSATPSVGSLDATLQ